MATHLTSRLFSTVTESNRATDPYTKQGDNRTSPSNAIIIGYHTGWEEVKDDKEASLQPAHLAAVFGACPLLEQLHAHSLRLERLDADWPNGPLGARKFLCELPARADKDMCAKKCKQLRSLSLSVINFLKIGRPLSRVE